MDAKTVMAHGVLSFPACGHPQADLHGRDESSLACFSVLYIEHSRFYAEDFGFDLPVFDYSISGIEN